MPSFGRLRLPALGRALEKPEAVQGFGVRSPVAGLARRSVGFYDVLAQSTAAVAPTGVAITFPVIVMTQVGGPSLLAALLAVIATLLVAASVSEFARRMAVTGSLYTYVSRALGPMAGSATSLALQLGYGFIALFCLASSVEYFGRCLARITGAEPGVFAVAAMLVVLGAGVVVLIARGVRLTLRFLLVVEVVTAAVVLVLVIALLVRLRADIDWALFDIGSTSPQNVSAGAAIVMTAFVGFESSTAIGAEARRPFRDIPRALIWTVLGVGILYFLSATSQLLAYRSIGIDPDSAGTPVNDIATAYGLSWLGVVLDLSVAVSFFACATASTIALVRVIFSLGKEGLLPSRLAYTHQRLETPIAAAVATAPFVVLVPAALVSAGLPLAWVIETSLVVATAGYLTAYLLVCVATPVFLRLLSEMTLRPVVSSVVAALTVCGVLTFYLTYEWTNHAREGVVIFGLGLVVGALSYVTRVRRMPEVRRRIGLYDEPTVDDVLGAHAPTADPTSPVQ